MLRLLVYFAKCCELADSERVWNLKFYILTIALSNRSVGLHVRFYVKKKSEHFITLPIVHKVKTFKINRSCSLSDSECYNIILFQRSSEHNKQKCEMQAYARSFARPLLC